MALLLVSISIMSFPTFIIMISFYLIMNRDILVNGMIAYLLFYSSTTRFFGPLALRKKFGDAPGAIYYPLEI